MRSTFRKVAIAAAALALGTAIFGGVYAGATALDIQVNGSGQQGAVTVTGDCQTGPLTVTFQAGVYDGTDGFLYDSVTIEGIDAACTSGDVAITADGTAVAAHFTPSVAGTAVIGIDADQVPVGAIDSVAIALFAD